MNLNSPLTVGSQKVIPCPILKHVVVAKHVNFVHMTGDVATRSVKNSFKSLFPITLVTK